MAANPSAIKSVPVARSGFNILIVLVSSGCTMTVAFADDTAAVRDQRDINTTELTLNLREIGGAKISEGQFTVYENRKRQSGRRLKLDVVVLHATGESSRPDPIFYLAGGPGVGAASQWRRFSDSWMREDRDIVLMNQRGTGGSNQLRLPSQESQHVQDSLKPLIRSEKIDEAISVLSRNADLRMYSTPDAMDDLNDLRIALGYRRVNLIGGSYGTRAALVYIRRHEDSVRTAVLNGVAPVEFTIPLYFAQSAQLALDRIFDRVESRAEWRRAFPDLRAKFNEILARFKNGPIRVEVPILGNKDVVSLKLDRDAFVSSLRYQLYFTDTSRRVPAMLMQAWRGDFQPFVASAIKRNQTLSRLVSLGLQLCVTAAEDVDRIDAADIEPLTRGTFLGAGRVFRQIENSRKWPRSKLPKDYGEPVRSDVPALILSGKFDPVTPPRWGQKVADNFPNSRHIVAPAAHGVGGPCIDVITRDFLDRGTAEDLDTSCVENMSFPSFELPPADSQK